MRPATLGVRIAFFAFVVLTVGAFAPVGVEAKYGPPPPSSVINPPGSLELAVVDATTGEPVPWANLVRVDESGGWLAGGDGVVRLAVVPPGVMRVRVVHLAYDASAGVEVIIESGKSNLCQAVPPDEFLDDLERRFHQHRLEAKRELQALPAPSVYGGIFHLKSVEQVIQRARAMVREAGAIVLCDLSPGPCAQMADALREAAASGVLVACHVYAEEEIEGVHTLHVPNHDPGSIEWPGQHVGVVVDSREHVLGLLAMDMESVHEAIWSSSVFLSCMQHNNLAAELVAIGPVSTYAGPAKSADDVVNNISLMQFHPPGLGMLIDKYGAGRKWSPGDDAPQGR